MTYPGDNDFGRYINEITKKMKPVLDRLAPTDHEPNWGSSGETVFQRTYARTKPDGSKESWYDTVVRVVDGNLALVDEKYHEKDERRKLIDMIYNFKMLPAGRHLWATGVPGAQYLINCFVSHWTDKPSDHFEYSFLRAMEGGGVGTNYSTKYLPIQTISPKQLKVHIVCDEWNQDYQTMEDQGLLSHEYGQEWTGAYEVEDSREGWAAAIVDLIDTYFRDDVKNVNRVYDVTKVRPSGARLKHFGGTASGPAPLARAMIELSELLNEWNGDQLNPLLAMEMDHILAQCVVAGGVRRTARMSIVEWDDPDIMDFIYCKQDTTKHWTTNISVAIDQEFLDLVEAEDIRAVRILQAVATAMVDNGEPGMVNLGLARETDPDVVCCNPCGEQFLSPWDACNLGHVNLGAFPDALHEEGKEYDELVEAHRLMARMLVRATFGDKNDPKQKETIERNRRIGVGHFGYASFVALNGIYYSDSWREKSVQGLLEDLFDVVKESADQYAHQLRIPAPLKYTTIAPTGSIAKLPGETEGIHPVMFPYYLRRIRFNKARPSEAQQLADYEAKGFNVERDIYDKNGNTWVVEIPSKDPLVDRVVARGYSEKVVEASNTIEPEQMLAVQRMYQRHYADNAVSYTVNFTPGTIAPEGMAKILLEFLPELKGTTVFAAESRPQSPYEEISKAEFELFESFMVADSVDEECSSGACPIR